MSDFMRDMELTAIVQKRTLLYADERATDLTPAITAYLLRQQGAAERVRYERLFAETFPWAAGFEER